MKNSHSGSVARQLPPELWAGTAPVVTGPPSAHPALKTCPAAETRHPQAVTPTLTKTLWEPTAGSRTLWLQPVEYSHSQESPGTAAARCAARAQAGQKLRHLP